MNHTPTPWNVRSLWFGDNFIMHERVEDGDANILDRKFIAITVAKVFNRPDAAFIVRAVNHHDELVAALTDAVEALAAMRAMYEGWPKHDIPRWRELIERAKGGYVWKTNQLQANLNGKLFNWKFSLTETRSLLFTSTIFASLVKRYSMRSCLGYGRLTLLTYERR